MTDLILAQTDVLVTSSVGLTVRLVRSLWTTATGFIIPAGTVVRVLEYNPTTHKLMIDFGKPTMPRSLTRAAMPTNL